MLYSIYLFILIKLLHLLSIIKVLLITTELHMLMPQRFAENCMDEPYLRGLQISTDPQRLP